MGTSSGTQRVARGVILRLPAGLRYAEDFARAYARARGLSPPLAA